MASLVDGALEGEVAVEVAVAAAPIALEVCLYHPALCPPATP